MRLVKMLFLLITVVLLNGCTTAVKYKLDKDVYKHDAPMDCNLAVDVVEDARPAEEHKGALPGKKGFLVTSDKVFKPGIDAQISKTLVEHLKYANLFTAVQLKDVDNSLFANTQAMDALNKDGVNLAIVGKVKHFYGYQSGAGTSSVAVLFGLAGVLAEAMANPKTVGGSVEYADVKIIDVHDKKILWEGNIAHEFEEKDTFYDGAPTYALRALKEANNKFTKKIRDVYITELKNDSSVERVKEAINVSSTKE